MKFYCRFASIVAMLALAAASLVHAQQIEARVVGKVQDSSQAVLPGVTVTVTSVQNGAVRTVVTGGDGAYVVTNLNPGRYVVQMELSGFQTKSREIVLGVGAVETVDTSLAVGVTESINVTASAAVLDTTSARIGVNVSPEEVANLPVNGRNFANLMTLAPGATTDGNGGWASVRFNGKSNQQNYLNYDGVDGTYVWDASPGYLNATGSQFRLQTSMESVAEFRVNSGLAPAESGLGAGGNITVISKSGGNRFTGSLFEYIRNDALDSESKYPVATEFDPKKQQLELNQFGGSIGGPISLESNVLLRQLRGVEAGDRSELHRSSSQRRSDSQDHGGRVRRNAVRPERGPHPGCGAAAGRLPTRNGRNTSNPLLALANLQTQATQKRAQLLGPRWTTASATVRSSTAACSTAMARWTRLTARSRRAASRRRSSR